MIGRTTRATICQALAIASIVLLAPSLLAAEEPLDARIAAAVKRGLPLVEKAAENYPTHRKCFSCHHQTLPMLAVVCARQAGLGGNEAILAAQAEFTLASFHGELEDLRAGRGIGGRAMTVTYGLWALALAARPADETTAAMVEYLLKTQKDDGHWEGQSVRPPMEESYATCTVLAVGGLRQFATEEQKPAVEAAIGKAKTWLINRVPESQEDRAARLWGMHQLAPDSEEFNAAREAVLSAQRPDGGWSQMAEMESDAYSTGQALVVLRASGLNAAESACQRAAEFLLKTQQDDGSWFVATRAKPVQVLFDNGDPHGKDQFISTPATSWALAALSPMAEKVGPKP
jgi:N-acyl-D-amino-acid deacylase